jgi:hypothetical protein
MFALLPFNELPQQAGGPKTTTDCNEEFREKVDIEGDFFPFVENERHGLSGVLLHAHSAAQAEFIASHHPRVIHGKSLKGVGVHARTALSAQILVECGHVRLGHNQNDPWKNLGSR